VNEIITYGQGYKLSPGIKVFVNSAKKFSKTVTVIGSGLTKELVEFLKDNNVNLVDSKELSERFKIQNSLSPYTLKVIYFYLYVKRICTASNVYLCDFTDLYFQKNPFELVNNTKPYVTTENEYIGNCETNTTWVRLCYNPDIYNLLKRYQILNGGTIFGRRESCADLLKEMCNDMTQIISRIGNYQNIDQASLNKVVYFDSPRYNVLKNNEVANLAHLANSRVNIGEQISINDNVPYVLHQYDVIKQVENYLYVNCQ
jgi:hypothetical protein